MSQVERRAWWTVMLALSALLMVVLWSSSWLPMTDLPQHEAQLALGLRLFDPTWRWAELYEFNGFTPYLMGYALAWALTPFTSVPTALRMVITLAVLAHPWALAYLLRAFRSDPWLAPVGFVLGFAFPFYWGMINFLFAFPLGLLYLGAVARWPREPGPWRHLALASLSLLLFFAHALVWGPILLATGLVLVGQRGLRGGLRTGWPILLSTLVATTWVLQQALYAPATDNPLVWQQSPYRPLQFFGTLLGGDVLAISLATILVATILVGRARATLTIDRVALLLIGSLLFMLAPATGFGTFLLWQRQSALVLVGLCLLSSNDGKTDLPIRVATCAVPALWLLILVGRFHAFDEQLDGWHDVTASIHDGERVLGLSDVLRPEPFPADVLEHVAARLPTNKDVLFEPSFAHVFSIPIRFRQASGELSQALRHDTDYQQSWVREHQPDAIVLHGPDALARRPELAKPPWQVVLRSGPWTVLRRHTP